MKPTWVKMRAEAEKLEKRARRLSDKADRIDKKSECLYNMADRYRLAAKTFEDIAAEPENLIGKPLPDEK